MRRGLWPLSRDAVASDLPMIVDLLEQFHGEADQPQEFNRQDTVEFMAGMIENHIVIVSENGVICGIIAPTPVNKAWKVAFELYWYAKDGKGGKLLMNFMKTARELGASEIRLSSRVTTPKIGKFLERMGFSHDEQVYRSVV